MRRKNLDEKMMIQSFGTYSLDSRSVLSREGKTLNLPPKELALLKLLLRYEGAIVSHDLIEQELWPRQSVSYASITRCVYSLRKLIDDGLYDYVLTVPKRGYRLGVPVYRSSPPAQSSTAKKVASGIPQAYAHFLEGQRLANTGDFEKMARAIKLYDQACRVDPDFAVAYAAKADCRMYQSIRGYVLPAEGMMLGLADCRQALEIDDLLAPAHAARGWFFCAADDMNEGFVSLKTALEIDPDYARGYSYLSFAQRLAGLAEESVANARQAVELDPYSILNRHGLAWRLFCSGKAGEALEIERRHTSERPNDAMSQAAYGLIASWLGAHEKSLPAVERAIELAGENPGLMSAYTYALARAGKIEQAKSRADALLSRSLPRAPRSHLAMTYVQLGDYDRALELLREAREEKCPWFRLARFDPRIEGLGADPRLHALYRDLQWPDGSSDRLALVS